MGPLAGALGRWVDGVRRRAPGVALATALATLGCAWMAATRLGIDTDTTDMLSEDLQWRRDYDDYGRAFPDEVDQLLVMVEAGTPERAEAAGERLAARLREEADLFPGVHVPGSGPFFERHGLLYRDAESLRETAERLESLAPLLARVERDPTLPGLLAAVEDLLAAAGGEAAAAGAGPDRGGRGDGARGGPDPVPVLGALARAFGAQPARQPFHLSWQALLGAERDAGGASGRRLIVVRPRLDYGALLPAGEALGRLRALVAELGLEREPDVEVLLSGSVAMEHEELESVLRGGAAVAAGALVMVGGILFLGLGSLRLVGACLATLVAGLTATAAFAAVAVGRLNLISVAFAVLYIGLGIDYAIHLALRRRELVAAGADPAAALRRTARDVGPSVALSALTTAACFYAFVPTDFEGVAELGIIAGTGMFVGLAASLTVLPALLTLLPPERGEDGEGRPGRNGVSGRRVGRPEAGAEPGPVRSSAARRVDAASRALAARPRAVLAASLAVTAVAGAVALQARFDADPLALRDPEQESVVAYRRLLADTTASPLTVSVVEPDLAAARRTAERLAALPEVRSTLTLADFVPERQSAKREAIGALARALPPAPPDAVRPAPTSAGAAFEAVASLRRSLALFRASASREAAEVARYLGIRLRAWERWARGWPPEDRERLVADLERRLVGGLPERMRELRAALDPPPVALEDLPPDLVERWAAPAGYRVEVQPAVDVGESGALERFVDAVRERAPRATGVAVTQVEAGKDVVRAFRRALALAVAATVVILVLALRSVRDAGLVLLPLALAGALTGATAVLLGIGFNFANVIALPLLLGVGVDNGIHMVHRARTAPPPGGDLLRTSTARATVFASLTTLAGFANLALAPHPGMAGMGRLLTVGMAAVLVSTLLVLPPLLRPRRRGPGEERRPGGAPPSATGPAGRGA